MSQAFDFGHLVDLCRRTHEESQRSAARVMDTHLVTRNWLFGQQTRIGPTLSDQFVSPLAVTSPPLDEAVALLADRFSLGWLFFLIRCSCP